MKPIAFYLPQYYPIPENDEWWGEGFTEWTNVKKAKPRFRGHYQPHKPAYLGYYDLRIAETLHKQAELAKKFHLYGFCFYHYWFSGKQLLEKPVNLYINEKVDFPFCLCWANQNWTRAWDGNEREVLLKQEYSFEDDTEHIRYLTENYFSAENYIKIDNKPVFVVYRTELFPDIIKTANIWRREVKKFGFDDIYLINIENITYNTAPESITFDAGIDFHPKGKNLPEYVGRNRFKNILNRFNLYNSAFYENYVWDYKDYCNSNTFEEREGQTIYPALFPMWDNASRRDRNAWIFHGSTPKLFENWLTQIIRKFNPPNQDEDFIFINAWNEWAEGCHLEPCQKWGDKYLNIIKQNLPNHHNL